jgi:thimet oligopeptidase
VSRVNLEPLPLPAVDEDWAAYVAVRADDELRRSRELADQLRDGGARSADEIIRLWNEADLALRNAGSLASLLAQVHPDEAVRTLAETREQDVSRLATERGLDRALFDAVSAVDPGELDEPARRLLGHTLRDFRRSGVDRDDATRARLREIAERATVVGQEFSRNIRDDVRSVKIAPELLAGLPQDYLDAHPAGDDGLVTITTDYPDYVPFRTFARDGAARRALSVEFLNRAWPANDALLAELLDLRAEQAQLLGYADWAGFDA